MADKRTLKEIAIELLFEYETAERCLIYETSFNISRSGKRLAEEVLAEEVKRYRQEIENAEA